MSEIDWDNYRTAVIEMYPAGLPRVDIDLTSLIGEGTVRAVTEASPGPTFAIITACNPRGAQYSAEENEEHALELEDRLTRDGTRFIRADGCSPDRAHRERGVAAKLERIATRDLAITLEQAAFYWWDGMRFWLVPTIDRQHEPEALPLGAYGPDEITEDQTLRTQDFMGVEGDDR